jgi:hypothetical protein
MSVTATSSCNTFCRHVRTKGLQLRLRHMRKIGGCCLQSQSLWSVDKMAPKVNFQQGHTRTFSSTLGVTRSIPPKAKLQQVLEQAGFTVFQYVSDLGFYKWTPRGSYRNLSETTADEFIEAIDLHERPKQIVDAKAIQLQLPIEFATLVPDEHHNRYPYSQYEIASLYVALKHRHVRKESIKFCFGGSTLEMLANQCIENDEMYLVTVVPGTGIILVSRHADYIQNKNAHGFQFERVATGGKCTDPANVCSITHLQMINVAGHTVLFSAEADAVDANGDSVEIKARKIRYWGTKTMFRTCSCVTIPSTLCG